MAQCSRVHPLELSLPKWESLPQGSHARLMPDESFAPPYDVNAKRHTFQDDEGPYSAISYG